VAGGRDDTGSGERGGWAEGRLEPGSEAPAGGPQHAWDDPVWGTGIPPAGLEERGGQQLDLELIGDRLRVSGVADLGRFRRLTDYVNMLQGFFTLRDVTLLSRTGAATRVTMPELRVRLDDVAIVAQRGADQAPLTDPAVLVEKVQQRLVIMTPAHIVAGDVHVHAGGSILHFVDSTDPRFIPMSDVRVRWLDDHALVGQFPFALVHRTQILGVATEGLGAATEPGARRGASGAGPTEVSETTAEHADEEMLL
jgi:hypothetical protein